ncbi:hypothetical protein SLE2022_354610 [Rubroshorea leprosula]
MPPLSAQPPTTEMASSPVVPLFEVSTFSPRRPGFRQASVTLQENRDGSTRYMYFQGEFAYDFYKVLLVEVSSPIE